MDIYVIIPAFNEEASIKKVVSSLPGYLVRETIVVDNNSTDLTQDNARAAGATVIKENMRGYGAACLKGISYLSEGNKFSHDSIVVFLDGDYSDHPEQLPRLLEPILSNNADMVVGSRVLGHAEKGSLTIPQRFGNWLAVNMIRLFYGYRYTDLGPFRAILLSKLQELNMKDTGYGWTVEMQIKAIKQNLKVQEVPTDYRKRIGKSKISGTIKGTLLAGIKIIYIIFRNAAGKY